MGGARLALAALLLGLPPVSVGCGANPSPIAEPPAVPGAPYQVWIHASGGGPQELYFRNDSEGIYWISGVILRDCMNIRETCGVHELDVVACPGTVHHLLSVRPANPATALYFDWDWDAERYESEGDRIGLECGEG